MESRSKGGGDKIEFGGENNFGNNKTDFTRPISMNYICFLNYQRKEKTLGNIKTDFTGP